MRREIIAVPTIFDAAKKKNLRTASFFWPETRGDLSIDYNIPETFLADTEQAGMREVAPAFLGELRQAGIPIDLFFQWYTDLNLKGAADAILAQAAAHVIRKHRPHLLAIHLLVTDATQHAYGPAHYLSGAALTQADYCVGILRQAVRDAGVQDRTTFIIAADHGFHTVAYEVNLHPLFKDAGLLDRIKLYPDGWSLYVELQNNFDHNRDLPALRGVLERARKLEGVARVAGPEDFHKLGLPRYEENPHVPGQYLIIADIDTYLVSQESNSSTARVRKTAPAHSHGYLPDHPRMYPSLVLSGFQVRKAVRIGHTSNYVIAPTISHLLNLEMTGFSAGMLREALEPQ
jgi:predicted AlkP superfamily pyrophosphatase or phosphodiesterase